MFSKALPAYCSSGKALEPAGVVIHYFSAKNVDPDNAYDLETCRRLFLDLNRPRAEREWFMLEGNWPEKRMHASAHILIGRDGTIWKLIEYDKQAYHAGKSVLNGRINCNGWTLGVELVGKSDSGFEDEQYEALAGLLRLFCTNYEIPRDSIAGHDTVRRNAIEAGMRAKPKYDPSGQSDGLGDNFDWALAYELLDEQLDADPIDVAVPA